MAETATEPGVFNGSGPHGVERLSWRENQVIFLIAEGATDREIAATLFLAESTVASDVRRLRAKLGARNRAHAVALWFRSSDPPPPPPVRHARLRDADRRPANVDDVVELLPDLIAQMFGGMVGTGRATKTVVSPARARAHAFRLK